MLYDILLYYARRQMTFRIGYKATQKFHYFSKDAKWKFWVEPEFLSFEGSPRRKFRYKQLFCFTFFNEASLPQFSRHIGNSASHKIPQHPTKTWKERRRWQPSPSLILFCQIPLKGGGLFVKVNSRFPTLEVLLY